MTSIFSEHQPQVNVGANIRLIINSLVFWIGLVKSGFWNLHIRTLLHTWLQDQDLYRNHSYMTNDHDIAKDWPWLNWLMGHEQKENSILWCQGNFPDKCICSTLQLICMDLFITGTAKQYVSHNYEKCQITFQLKFLKNLFCIFPTLWQWAIFSIWCLNLKQ